MSYYTLLIKVDDSLPKEYFEYYENFESHYEGDAGIDLLNPDTIHIEPFGVGTLDFKIKCEMLNQNDKNVSYYLYPRSSISKTSFQMANSVGIIDAGYRGNIMAKVRNISQIENSINSNERLFQICAPDLKPIKVRLVHELSESSRGEGGFGSTGK